MNLNRLLRHARVASRRWHEDRRRWFSVVATFAAYAALVQSFSVVSVPPQNVALLWLPNAALAVALLRTERRWWWTIWLAGMAGEVVGDALQGIAPHHAVAFGVVNLVEATALVLAVERFGGPFLMRSARSVAVFLAAAITVPAVTGMLGALVSAVAFGSQWLQAWPAWWFGDAIGLVVGVPIGLAALDLTSGVAAQRTPAVRRAFAAAGLAAGSTAVALSVANRPEQSQHLTIAVAVILALGLGTLGSAIGGMLVALITVVPAVRHVGTLSVVESQAFLLVVSGSVLFVGAVIEAEHRAVTAMRRTEARLRTTFEDAPIGMAISDLTPGRSGRWLEVNTALSRTLGRSAADLLATHPASLVHPEDGADDDRVAALVAGAPGHLDTERRYRHADGHYIWCRVVESVVRDPASGAASYAVTQVVDVTATKDLAAGLAHAALHDPLTGLPNRTLLMDRLALGLAALGRNHEALAVLYVDVDHFKQVNDELGHAAGDAVLVEVAQRLRSTLRPGDTVARLGGDEFAVICTDIEDEQRVTSIAERLTERLNRPVTISGQVVDLSSSVGVAMTRDRDHNPSDLLRAADTAMYLAKTGGRGRFELFRPVPDLR